MTNPIWVVKTRLCLKDTDVVPKHMRYKGLIDGLVNLYRYEGLRGCYKGYFPGLLGVSHGALQFMLYEELKNAYCNYYNLQLTTKLVRVGEPCYLWEPITCVRIVQFSKLALWKAFLSFMIGRNPSNLTKLKALCFFLKMSLPQLA